MIAFDPYGSLFHVPGVDYEDPLFRQPAGIGALSAFDCLRRAVSGDFGWVSLALQLWPRMTARADRDALQVLLPHVMSASDLALLPEAVSASAPDDALWADLVDILIRSGEVGALRSSRAEIGHLGTDGEEPLVLAQSLVLASADPAVLAPNPFKSWDPLRHDRPEHLHAEWRRTFDELFSGVLENANTGEGILLGKPLDLRATILACLDEILPARLGYRFVEIRPFLEATTGADLSGCFVDDDLDQNLARHELEMLYDRTDFDAFELGVRYFFGHRIER